MKFKLIGTFILLGCATLANAEKNDKLYNLYLQKSLNLEKKYIACSQMPAGEKANACIYSVRDAYTDLIKSIRKSSGSNVDEKLWQRLNINFEAAKDTCGSSLNTGYPNPHYEPFHACAHTIEYAFFTTTINLHYQ